MSEVEGALTAGLQSSREKEEMLARIGRALGREASRPEPLPPFDGAVGRAPLDAEGLLEWFRREARQSGARVESVETDEALREYVSGLLPHGGGAAVALSDGRDLRDAGLHEWLAGRGVEVVPASDESAPDGQGARRLRGLLRAAVGVSSADFAIAETGTLVLLAGGERHRLVSLLPPVYVCLLDPRRIVADMATLLRRLRDELYTKETLPPLVTFVTGPSCTADIEQTLTKGMHGPRELHILLRAPHGRPHESPGPELTT